MKNLKIYQEAQVGEYKFAILLDEEEKMAYEAIWNEQEQCWDTDFSYAFLDVDSCDVAGELDFDAVEQMGYTFLC